MKLSQFIKDSENRLKQADIGSAHLDTLILLEDSLHKDRSWLLAHPEFEVSDLYVKRISRKLERRARHIPLAYVRGHTEFYGRRFKVNRHTLEPRPESETMITLLKSLHSKGQPWKVADVGTGCGAIGITAKLEMPEMEVDLYDISAGAISVAKHNTHLHELHLHVRKMNLLSRPLREYDIVLANLPYVPTDWKINQAAMAEPKIAIFGGKDGLDVYRKLFNQLHRFDWKPKYVLTESMPPQHKKITEIAKQAGFKINKSDDFIQVYTKSSNQN